MLSVALEPPSRGCRPPHSRFGQCGPWTTVPVPPHGMQGPAASSDGMPSPLAQVASPFLAPVSSVPTVCSHTLPRGWGEGCAGFFCDFLCQWAGPLCPGPLGLPPSLSPERFPVEPWWDLRPELLFGPSPSRVGSSGPSAQPPGSCPRKLRLLGPPALVSASAPLGCASSPLPVEIPYVCGS